jgi:hypothetical protein
VHHRVADLQLRQVLDQRVDVADLFLLAAPACGRAGREEFGFGDELDRDARVGFAVAANAFGFEPEESLGQWSDRDREVFVTGLELVE